MAHDDDTVVNFLRKLNDFSARTHTRQHDKTATRDTTPEIGIFHRLVFLEFPHSFKHLAAVVVVAVVAQI